MPDFGPAVDAAFKLADLFGPPVRRAIAVLLRTTLGMFTLGLIVATASYYIAADGSWVRGFIAVLLALVTSGIVAVFVGIKRAVGKGLLSVLGRARLGERLVGNLFQLLLKGEDDLAFRERGTSVARTVERVPLAEASQRLERAVNHLLSERAEGTGLPGWFSRHMRDSALERVRLLTLAQFRKSDAESGGVDLVVARQELGGRVDQLLVDQIEAMLTKVTALAVSILLLVSLGGAFALRHVHF